MKEEELLFEKRLDSAEDWRAWKDFLQAKEDHEPIKFGRYYDYPPEPRPYSKPLTIEQVMKLRDIQFNTDNKAE